MEPNELSGQLENIEAKPLFVGPYSAVYSGVLNGEFVAIKVLQPVSGCVLHTMRRKINRERTVWGMLDHPNILPLYGFAEEDTRFQPSGALISPWYRSGNASTFLSQYGPSLANSERTGLWTGVISGVQYLHNHNPCIVHGDLKPSNVLIGDNGNPRICDFGLVAIFLEAGNSGLTTTSPHSGTERYLAPELVITEGHAQITTATDIYALGCIGLEACASIPNIGLSDTYQFVFSLLPYDNRRNCHSGLIIGDIFRGVKPANRPSQLDNSLEGVWSLVERCLNRDATQRPTAGELLSRLEFSNVHSDPPLDSTQIPDAGEALHNSDPEIINAPPDSTQPPAAEEVLLRTQIVNIPNENRKRILVHDDRSMARQSKWKNDDQAWNTITPIPSRNSLRPFTEHLKLMGDMQRWDLYYTFEAIGQVYDLRWIATVLLSGRCLAVSMPQRSKAVAKEMAAMAALHVLSPISLDHRSHCF
ncbi:hypothetical protein FRC17_008864 [Serendipita sp. 399]|nr:hypothetical protein FRC17_008864 [Serendipita sp. 399]